MSGMVTVVAARTVPRAVMMLVEDSAGHANWLWYLQAPALLVPVPSLLLQVRWLFVSPSPRGYRRGTGTGELLGRESGLGFENTAWARKSGHRLEGHDRVVELSLIWRSVMISELVELYV